MSSSEWREVKVSEIGKIVTGKTPKTAISENYGGNIPFLTPSDDMNIKKVKSTARTLSEMGLNSVKNCLLPAKSICVSCIGSDLGKVVLTSEPTVTNQQINSIVPDEKFDPDFIYYGMTILGKHLNYLSKTSTAVPIINKTTFSNFSIIVPSIEEQKAIAHILSTLDDKIEVNNQINKTLENMAQAIFKQWFVDFEFPNENGEPYKSSGGEMVESELGLIPKGWEVKKVEQVTKIIRGASPRPIQDFIRDEGIPWVKISDASSSNTRFISSTKEFIKEEGRKKSREVKVGTLILSNSATPGIPMIMKIDACVHDGWLIFDEFREVTKEYMFHFLTENRIGILSLSNGSVFRNLKTDILKNYKIIIPSRDVVARVDNIFKSINNSIDNIENQITTLTKIRDGLLTKLMSGEIRVPLDEEGDVS